MAVRRLRKSWWVDIYHRRVRYRRRSPINSRAGALRYEVILRQELLELDKIERRNAKRPTFAKFALEHWLGRYLKNRAKASTQRSYGQALRAQLVPAFGHLRIDKIDEDAVERFIEKRLAAHLNPKTLNNDLIVLSSCLRIAKELSLIDRKPKIKLLKRQQRAFTPLTQEECIQLLNGIENDTVRLMALCGMHTGMRFGELLGLQWKNVRIEERQITVCNSIVDGVETCTKTYRVRYLPISEPLLRAFTQAPRFGPYVFARPNGRPLYRSLVVNSLKIGAERAGLQDVSFQLLRHTFASLLSSAGTDVRVLKELMGHADAETTANYIHVSAATLRKTVGLLDGIESKHQ